MKVACLELVGLLCPAVGALKVASEEGIRLRKEGPLIGSVIDLVVTSKL